MPTDISNQPVVLLRVRDVCQRVNLSRQRVYERMNAGKFPKPIHVAPRSPRWRADEIDAFIERLSAERAA